jgi:MFS transporter, ACS family, glucarate transporter
VRTADVGSRVLVLAFFASAVTYLDRVAISAAAPRMMSELGLSAMQMGYVFGAFQAAYGVFEIPMGWMGDRFGQRRVLVRIVASWSVLTLLTGAVWNFASLITVRLLFGAAEAGAYPNLAKLLGRHANPKRRTLVQGLLWTGARLGGAVSPPLFVALMLVTGWRAAFGILCVIGLLWSAVFLRIYHEPVEKVAQAIRPPTPWRAILRSRNLWMLCGMYFASSYGLFFIATWLPTYLRQEHGVTLAAAGAYSSLPPAAGAAGCMLGGILSDALVRRTGSLRLGRAAVGFSAYALGAAGFAAATLARSPLEAVGALAFAQGTLDLAMPASWATSVEIGGRFGAVTAAFMNTASCISAALSPVSAAWLQRAFGSFHPMFLVAAGLYACAACLWLLIDPGRTIMEDPLSCACP